MNTLLTPDSYPNNLVSPFSNKNVKYRAPDYSGSNFFPQQLRLKEHAYCAISKSFINVRVIVTKIEILIKHKMLR